MPAALIRFDRKGRVLAIYLVADTEQEATIVELGLARIIRPRAWGWLKRLFKRGSR